MYERFFRFREKPFSLTPDPAFLYLGRHHSAAYSLLEYGVLSQAGLTVVTGEVGCGKTTLIRHLLNQLPDQVTVGLISNTHHRFDNLLEWVLMSFGVDYQLKSAVSLYESFVNFLIAEYARGRRTILVIDEAQNLDTATLEELRTLSNINAQKDQVLQTILVGQPELRTTLSRPELRQFAQRVVAHYHLGPLSEEETQSYIGHRLAQAGGRSDLFTLEACRRIYRQSGGVPRLINLICDTTLVYAFAEDAQSIDAELVQAVIDERAAGFDVGAEDHTSASAAPGLRHVQERPAQSLAPATITTHEDATPATRADLGSRQGQHADHGTLPESAQKGASRSQSATVVATECEDRMRSQSSVRSTVEKAMDRKQTNAKTAD